VKTKVVLLKPAEGDFGAWSLLREDQGGELPRVGFPVLDLTRPTRMAVHSDARHGSQK